MPIANSNKIVFGLLVLGLVQACSSSNGRYRMSQDAAPVRLPTTAELRDPIPRQEPPSRQGNKTYELFGNTYHVMGDVRDYQQEGTASWYGQKFHGHLTSNGEYYDMFSMSAAHKTLPLPTYVRVTNLANNKSVIVRVNDRGPFHGDRLIDLSYSAAYKIGMLATGTARVRVETVQAPLVEVAESPEPAAPSAIISSAPAASTATETAPANETKYFIQVMAGTNNERLQQEADALSQLYQVPATTQANDGLYRLVLGPFANAEATDLLQRLKDNGHHDVFRVQLP
ncbi:rare lipoprotein A [Pseudidiomarina planktonica]|uniref:Endolytic peptidoglycan transglycosylase RlpA n=1 Tax=Pseudidiomarina planktonica TaxID=1323738 RepID=A0A1Y6EM47_9GAMM|nr:septal ring lytic transglycosylase RlpA family protein [Pseudidiomarina planktonica]RUO65656.1 septal ring lytic transglycosylase RlpA family protein [Pseudidiomarina planktonica]SMQ63738.1 rare lipoprotein A [Pseudidiomarina planktonica]